MDHEFTGTIRSALDEHFSTAADEVFEHSPLLQYINLKTRSANRGSKSRGSFANLYALYVLTEDYLAGGFDKKGNYSSYEGAVFSRLFERQRELPFGSKLQNHALNHRLNEEFKKFFPSSKHTPILREPASNRYWINQHLLRIKVAGKERDLATSVIEIINAYIKTKSDAFNAFIDACVRLKSLTSTRPGEVETFILDLLSPNKDARLFEIVSFAVLKAFYHGQIVYFGVTRDKLTEERLKLYKTGRTNANDGGIDFVMKPLGRFFQVTETVDVKKYFLDIDKIERFPISFVIKSAEPVEVLRQRLEEGARQQFGIQRIVECYMGCIEEIINVPMLRDRFRLAEQRGHLPQILDEIVRQSKVEFNHFEAADESSAT